MNNEHTATEPLYETCPVTGKSGWHVTTTNGVTGEVHGHVFDDEESAWQFSHDPHRFKSKPWTPPPAVSDSKENTQ